MKHNRSGTVSVAIVDKQRGVYREIMVLGTSSDEASVAAFIEQGKDWIRRQKAQRDIFDSYEEDKSERSGIEYFFNNIKNILLNGPQLILNQVYGLIGFDRINDAVLKDLVVARICQPRSKAATVEYLKRLF